MQQSSTERVATKQAHQHEQHAEHQLGPFLCWAVVFADIGTSIYYVPGILYGTVGKLAGFFVFLTITVFILLTLKYVEVTYRFPQGGGVVTVAAKALNRWFPSESRSCVPKFKCLQQNKSASKKHSSAKFTRDIS